MRIQLTQPKQLVEVFLALFVVAVSLHAWFLHELRTRHAEVWRGLGEPSLFLNNSIRNGLRTLKFKWSSEATRGLGPRFRRLTMTLRVIDVSYVLVFIAIVWLRFTSHGG